MHPFIFFVIGLVLLAAVEVAPFHAVGVAEPLDTPFDLVEVLTGNNGRSISARTSRESSGNPPLIQPTTGWIPSIVRPTGRSGRMPKPTSASVNVSTQSSKNEDQSNTYPFPAPLSESKLREESWVIPLIALASANLVVMACFEGFVLVKMAGSRPSRRHFFLGQMLLLGLALSSLIGFAYVTPPSLITCTVVRLGVGLSYALVFGTLLVKAVFLISLNGGVYLPPAYHGLLLFFAVAVQVVVGVQWLVHRPPALLFREGPRSSVTLASCSTTLPELLLSLAYDSFLLLFVTALAIKARGIRDNYREAMYIGLAVGCTVPLWVAWTTVAMVLRDGYEEPCVAFGLVVNASLTFVVMFVPKGRQLAAVGKEGLYVEDQDREDHLSTASPPSVCTPSFYHFKPALSLNRDCQGTLFKTPIPPDRTMYSPPPPGRIPRYISQPHGYYLHDEYYSMTRTNPGNPNVQFFRNPMMY